MEDMLYANCSGFICSIAIYIVPFWWNDYKAMYQIYTFLFNMVNYGRSQNLKEYTVHKTKT